MKNMFDNCEREYIFDRGWKINSDGLVALSAKQFEKYAYTGTLLKDPSKRTLMLPSMYGCTLIIEGLHFVVED